MPVQFHLDENVDPAVAAGLERRGIDVTTTASAGLIGATDEQQLAFATNERRAIFTQDEDFLSLAAMGGGHSGVIYCKQGTRTIGQIIEFLQLIDLCMTEDDMRDHVEFV